MKTWATSTWPCARSTNQPARCRSCACRASLIGCTEPVTSPHGPWQRRWDGQTRSEGLTVSGTNLPLRRGRIFPTQFRGLALSKAVGILAKRSPLKKIFKKFENKWSNLPSNVLDDILIDSQQEYWWMSTTYYAPERSGGSIVFLPLPSNQSEQIGHVRVTKHGKSGQSKNWYYSMIDWVDMNQDGWLDIVTTRSHVMPGSIKVSELIWLQNPGLQSLWTSRRRWVYCV